MPKLPADFDEKEYAAKEIFPLLEQLWNKCHDRGIPMVASVCYAVNVAGHTVIANNMISTRGGTLPGFLSDIANIIEQAQTGVYMGNQSPIVIVTPLDPGGMITPPGKN